MSEKLVAANLAANNKENQDAIRLVHV